MLFTAFFAWQIITYALGILRLVDMYRFYTYLLHIPDVSAASSHSALVLSIFRKTSRPFLGQKS